MRVLPQSESSSKFAFVRATAVLVSPAFVVVVVVLFTCQVAAWLGAFSFLFCSTILPGELVGQSRRRRYVQSLTGVVAYLANSSQLVMDGAFGCVRVGSVRSVVSA
ncbi:hypothetical protein BKA81DRAFT_65791 [Phyllosticta paracitricarpa]|uniref:Uncharacterized protein n=1 Tax=Phyllosticta paracitricarpa TaxID=2016321 RepID=A0ABR1NHP4_9PEZI